jgi:sirohydrochlorin cobaltochelatase
VKESQRLLDSLVTGKISRIGQLQIVSSEEGFVLCHRDDVGRTDLKIHEIEDALEVAKFDDARSYRPLKTAPNLRHGWKIFARDLLQVEKVIDAIYPGRLAALHAFNSGQLTTTSLRETLNRQSGMYRVAARISDEQIDGLVGNFCRSDGGCLRTILWKRDASDKIPSSKLPPEKFDPAVDQYLSAKRPRSATAATESLPLLCQEACNLLVAACRDAVRKTDAPLAPQDPGGGT